MKKLQSGADIDAAFKRNQRETIWSLAVLAAFSVAPLT